MISDDSYGTFYALVISAAVILFKFFQTILRKQKGAFKYNSPTLDRRKTFKVLQVFEI